MKISVSEGCLISRMHGTGIESCDQCTMSGLLGVLPFRFL